MTENTPKLIRAFIRDTGISEKACPCCKSTKPIGHFGTRVLNGKRVAQSWCRKCRREAEAEKRAAERYAREHAAEVTE